MRRPRLGKHCRPPERGNLTNALRITKTVLTVECYTGVDEAMVCSELQSRLGPALVLRAGDAMLAPEQIDTLVAPFLGGEDPVFGFLSGLTLPEFYDEAKLHDLRAEAAKVTRGLVIIVGTGACMVA